MQRGIPMGKDKLIFYDYEIFQENGTRYVYSTNNSGLFEIDDRTYQFLLQEGKTFEEAEESVESLFSREELEELEQEMRDNQFIKTTENDREIGQESTLPLEDSIRAITIFLAQECNLRCTYCYGEAGEYADKGIITYETACKAVDFLIAHSGKIKNLSVAFFGGEPLIAYPIMKKLVVYIREKEKETGKSININMTCNGTLITEEIEQFLIQNKIHVQISIDGDRETHNANRFYANKKGSYDTVIERTESMRKKGLLSARATLTSGHMNLCSTFKHLDSLGFQSIAIAPAHNRLKEEDYEAYGEEEIQFIHEFESLVKQKEYVQAKKMKIVMTELKQVHNGGIRVLACGVGRTMYAVDIHGTIYPCQRFVNNKDYALGNIMEEKIAREEFLKEIELSKHENCQDCWVKNLCVGGCPHVNLSATGRTALADKKSCEVNKRIYKELIGVYLRLSEKEKAELLGCSC